MQGWLIVNGFWHSASTDTMEALLRVSAAKAGIDLTVLCNDELLMTLPDAVLVQPRPRPDFVLMWDKDIRLASLLELQGIPVFNSAAAIALCDDKTLTHMKLARLSIPTPTTILCPQTFANVGYTRDAFIEQVAQVLGLPFVLKEGCGSFGQQVYLVKDTAQAKTLMQSTSGPLLFQQFIAESFGRDVRLYIVGGQPVAAMCRMNTSGDFRANIAGGGHAVAYTPSKEECDLAIAACGALGLAFAGVDLLFGKDGPLLCEVNSNAHFAALADLTGINPADAIYRHIKEVL